MKKVFVLLLIWVPALHAGGEGKTATGWCRPILNGKECAATVSAFGCGSVSMVCCGSYMGGLCVHDSLLTSVQVMTLGSAGACVGIAGAVACAMCSGRYAQRDCKSTEQPVAVHMVYDVESQSVCSAKISEQK